MSSEKWYWMEPFRFEGQAVILEQGVWHDRPAYGLNRSLFYPEGGGQLGDRGTISFGGETRIVIDTQIREDEMILVIVNEQFPADVIGKLVEQRVNEEWRRRQMSQHTGQHLLSRFLQERYEAPTISARLGEQTFSVDVQATLFTPEQWAEIEDGLNTLILEDRPIRAWFPTAEELATLSLRKQPSVQEQIRIVQVEGFDVTPCGGTHCTRTGQVGMVHLQSIEKYKQCMRITASAGLDAVRDARKKEAIYRELQVRLSATPDTIISQIDLLRAQEQALATRLKERTQKLANRHASEIGMSKMEGVLVEAVLNEDNLEYARMLAKELAKQTSKIALVSCPVSDGAFVVLDQLEKNRGDVGAILKEVLQEDGGKGGGGALHAEGRVRTQEGIARLRARLEGSAG